MPPFLPRSNTMNNFTEDLTGLSRADLVYKAKLAEQAERCVRGPPACPYHFRQKLQKASPSCGELSARLARKGRGSTASFADPRPHASFQREEHAADASDDPFFWAPSGRDVGDAARSGTRSRAFDIYSPVVPRGGGVPRRSSSGGPVGRRAGVDVVDAARGP